MTLSTTLRTYDDCIDLFNRALQAKSGIWIEAEDRGQAVHLRTRLHQCRKLLRLQAMEIYAEGDVEYGVSPYESLVVKIKGARVYIEKHASASLPSGEIESAIL